MQRTASCSCGQLVVKVDGEPQRISVCHCLACQRRTGSTFGFQARFSRENVEIEGASTAYERVAESGNTIEFHFCPRCGSTVFYRLEGLPDAVVVPIGAFADPQFSPPNVSVYEVSKHPWVTLPEGVEHYD